MKDWQDRVKLYLESKDFSSVLDNGTKIKLLQPIGVKGSGNYIPAGEVGAISNKVLPLKKGKRVTITFKNKKYGRVTIKYISPDGKTNFEVIK